jgi:hypothetical protein
LPEIVAFAVRFSVSDFLRVIYIPIGAVRSVSMERVVIDRQRESIPTSWQRRPEIG